MSSLKAGGSFTSVTLMVTGTDVVARRVRVERLCAGSAPDTAAFTVTMTL